MPRCETNPPGFGDFRTQGEIKCRRQTLKIPNLACNELRRRSARQIAERRPVQMPPGRMARERATAHKKQRVDLSTHYATFDPLTVAGHVQSTGRNPPNSP